MRNGNISGNGRSLENGIILRIEKSRKIVKSSACARCVLLEGISYTQTPATFNILFCVLFNIFHIWCTIDKRRQFVNELSKAKEQLYFNCSFKNVKHDAAYFFTKRLRGFVTFEVVYDALIICKCNKISSSNT